MSILFKSGDCVLFHDKGQATFAWVLEHNADSEDVLIAPLGNVDTRTEKTMSLLPSFTTLGRHRSLDSGPEMTELDVMNMGGVLAYFVEESGEIENGMYDPFEFKENRSMVRLTVNNPRHFHLWEIPPHRVFNPMPIPSHLLEPIEESE